MTEILGYVKKNIIKYQTLRRLKEHINLLLKQIIFLSRNLLIMNLNISSLSKYVWKTAAVPGFGFQQVRNKWANALMIRDVKRRRMSAEHFLERSRINALRKNDVLPVEIREMADKEINKFEMNAIPLRINNRCVITSRPRGIVKDWRLSRMIWRHLADYNKLSGVQRAMWG